jgi:hypothetical protein
MVNSKKEWGMWWDICLKRDLKQEISGKKKKAINYHKKETGNGRIFVYKTKEGLSPRPPPPYYLSQIFC